MEISLCVDFNLFLNDPATRNERNALLGFGADHNALNNGRIFFSIFLLLYFSYDILIRRFLSIAAFSNFLTYHHYGGIVIFVARGGFAESRD